jgi:PHD/YefM family antitoxin component YafN of YafNO toxin-antitoxin module
MAPELLHVGARQFREDLADYLNSPSPIAITRHGQTVGYYLPARRKVNEEELRTLKEAVAQLQALMAEYGITEEEVLSDFRAARRHE